MSLRHPPSLVNVTVHKLDTGRKTAIYSIFAVAYAIVLYQCYTTLGDPYRNALAEIESLRETGALPGENWEYEDEVQTKQNKLA
eukprot:gene20844-15916_t